MARDNSKSRRPIVIIRRKPAFQRITHSGAWKVAYADFTTAMMAFFMLLWLLTVSDKVTLQGIADYFTPSNATMSNSSGSGSILAGTAAATEGAKSQGSIAPDDTAAPNEQEHAAVNDENTNKNSPNTQTWQSTTPTPFDTKMLKAEDEIKTAIQTVPDLSNFKDQILFDRTADGLRIQIVDTNARPMFERGNATLKPYARSILATIGHTLARQPNRLSIIGHTDDLTGAEPYSNWELSADRANSARRVLRAAHVSKDRIAEVVGRAASDPLYPDQTRRPENRRITLIVLREAPVLDPKFGAR
jgi:chemotaxis protein MotB